MAVTPAIPVILVELSPAIFPLAVMSPDTVSEPNVPTDVMFVWAAVSRVPLKLVAVSTPVTIAPV